MKKSEIHNLVREQIRTLFEANPGKKHPHLNKSSEQPNKEPQDSKPVDVPTSATPEQPNKEPQDGVPVAQAGSTNAPTPKGDPKTTEDTEAAEQAKQLGLKHSGWGNYKDSSGVVVARSIDGKLVKIVKKAPGEKQDIKDPYENPAPLGNPGGAKKYQAGAIQGKKEPAPQAPGTPRFSVRTSQMGDNAKGYSVIDSKTGKNWKMWSDDFAPDAKEQAVALAGKLNASPQPEQDMVAFHAQSDKSAQKAKQPVATPAKPKSGTVQDVAGQKVVKTDDGELIYLAPHFDAFPHDLKPGDKVNVQYQSTASKGYNVVTPAAVEPTAPAPAQSTAVTKPKSTPITKQVTASELKFLKKGIDKVGPDKLRLVLSKLKDESKHHDQRVRAMRLEAMLDVVVGSWRAPREEEDAALTAFLEQRGMEKVVPQGAGGPGIHPGWNKAVDKETSFDANADETVAKLMEMFKGDGQRLLRWLYKKLLTASSAGKERLGQYIGILVDMIGPQVGQVDAQKPTTDGSKPNGWETWMSA